MNFSNFLVLLFISLTISVGAEYEEVYTLKELQALNEFRPLAHNIVKKDYEKKDIYLIHWLRARDLNIKSSLEMLEKAMTWRKQNKVDEVLYDKELIAAAERLYPVGYGVARDKVGRPTIQTAYSRWDLRKGYLLGFNFDKFLIYNFEKISTMAYHSNHSQFMFLIDLNQFNLRQHACLACLQFYINYIVIYENNYPNMAVAHLAINSPRAFDTILNLVRNLFSPHTSRTLQVLGINKSEWQPKVLQFFDADQLSRSFGGTKKGGYQS